jgi:phosphatidylserine decarboxylase
MNHREPTPITSAQPGGGLCVRLELFWGTIRRAILRACFPAYVRRMSELRQGDCTGCPHEVIDSRDLKYLRPVCKCDFPPREDPYAYRDRIGLARYGLCEVLVFTALLLLPAVALLAAGWYLAAIVPLVGWVFVLSFFRDPERVIPTEAGALVSPADGTITHAEEVADPDFPGGRAFRVSIFLSVFNVHVNRLPRSGRVVGLRYYPGEYLDARSPDCAQRNEQFWIDLEDAELGCLVRVKKIAGAIARRIVCWLRPGEDVRAGARSGMIKFGSRTEVLLPVDVVRQLHVRVGDTVQGGSTILMTVGRA